MIERDTTQLQQRLDGLRLVVVRFGQHQHIVKLSFGFREAVAFIEKRATLESYFRPAFKISQRLIDRLGLLERLERGGQIALAAQGEILLLLGQGKAALPVLSEALAIAEEDPGDENLAVQVLAPAADAAVREHVGAVGEA